MLEKIQNSIFYTCNENLSDFKITCREYATAKTLAQILEDYESVNATSKSIKIFKNDKEIAINLDYKAEIEKVNNSIKDLEVMQDTLTFKAYVEKSKALASEKAKILEKYAFLKVKVVSVEYNNLIRINELKDLPQAFTNFVNREFEVLVRI